MNIDRRPFQFSLFADLERLNNKGFFFIWIKEAIKDIEFSQHKNLDKPIPMTT